MTEPTKLRNELEVASRVAATLNDARSSRALNRYIADIEAQLLVQRQRTVETII